MDKKEKHSESMPSRPESTPPELVFNAQEESLFCFLLELFLLHLKERLKVETDPYESYILSVKLKIFSEETNFIHHFLQGFLEVLSSEGV